LSFALFFSPAEFKHEPIAYIIGTQEFYGYEFKVTANTLIPRPETELLVSATLDFLRASEESSPKILDLGTGTGCIALTLTLEHQGVHVTAVDLSAEPLQVTEKNRAKLKLNPQRILIEQADVLAESFWQRQERFDALISNPPYIGIQEKKSLEKNVLGFEPHTALFAEDEGLAFYKTYAKFSHKLLKPHGKLFLELSPIIYEKVCQIFKKHNWQIVETITDLAGHKRHIICQTNL